MSLARRVLAFAGLPFLSLITPFLFLPILARVAGADAWVAIAVGQSVGGFAALGISLGYNTIGPAMVALAAVDERPALLARSLRARGSVWLPAMLVAAVVAGLVAPTSHRLEAVLMAVAMSLTGLASSWYMIGLGRAGLIAVYEIAPRIVATLAAVPLLLLLGQVVWYPALLVIASLVSVGAFAARSRVGRALVTRTPGELRAVLREHRSAVTTEVAAGAYNALAVTFVSAMAPAARAAEYISGDKLYRIGQYSVSALGNALQGWVVEENREHFAHRVRRSFVLHLALGLAGLAAFWLIGSPLTALLFGEAVAIDELTAIGFGVATLFIALGTTLGRITLVGLGLRREFMISVLTGAALGVPAVLLLASGFGAAGGAWGLAVGEFASVACQSFFVLRNRRALTGRVA